MEPATGGLESLFDDAIVYQSMATLGVDEVTARFALALHRGTVTGDIAIEGGDFPGQPLRPELLEPRVRFDAPGVRVSVVSGATASVSFSGSPIWEPVG